MFADALSRVTYAGSSSGTNWVFLDIGPGSGRGVGSLTTISVAVGIAVIAGTTVGAGAAVSVTSGGGDVGLGSALDCVEIARIGVGFTIASTVAGDIVDAVVGCASIGASVAIGTSVGSAGLFDIGLSEVDAGIGVGSEVPTAGPIVLSKTAERSDSVASAHEMVVNVTTVINKTLASSLLFFWNSELKMLISTESALPHHVSSFSLIRSGSRIGVIDTLVRAGISVFLGAPLSEPLNIGGRTEIGRVRTGAFN